MSRVRLGVTAAAVALVTAAAVVGSAAAGGGTPERRTLEVTLDEWTLQADADRVAAGPVTIVQRNTGRVEHELLVVRTDTPSGEIPQGLQGPAPQLVGDVVLGEVHDHSVAGAREEHVQPGAAKRERVRLKPGRYVLLCTLPGHYAAGQHGTLEVGG